jgi:phosphatidyl-myo-inositol alpha-mannosyltransferase
VRVMVICPYSLSVFGGVQGQAMSLTRSLRELGIDARLIGPCDGPPPEPGITSLGPSTRVSSNGSIAPVAAGKAVASRTLEAIRAFEPDVLHLHEPLCPGPTQAAIMGTDLAMVGTFHAYYEGDSNSWYGALRMPLQPLFEKLTVRTAVSKEAQEQVESVFGGACEILPNGVDVSRFAKAQPWPSPEPAVLFVGRHEPRKGLAVLLDAWAQLDRDAILWIVGDGPETDQLQGRKVRNVEWLGRISDEELARRERGATIFCAPSTGGESFGVVLLEAMAAGAAVVASDISGYRAVARPEHEAVLVPHDDAGALRDALRRLLDEPRVRTELVAAGDQRAAEFSMRRLAERFVPVFETAINQGPTLARRGRR